MTNAIGTTPTPQPPSFEGFAVGGTAPTGGKPAAAANAPAPAAPREYEEPPPRPMKDAPSYTSPPPGATVAISVSEKGAEITVTQPVNHWWSYVATYKSAPGTSTEDLQAMANLSKAPNQKELLQGLRRLPSGAFAIDTYKPQLTRFPTNMTTFQKHFPKEFAKWVSNFEYGLAFQIINQNMQQNQKTQQQNQEWLRRIYQGG